MDPAKRLRTPLRAQLTRTFNEVEAELVKDVPDQDALKQKLRKLERTHLTVKMYDDQVLRTMGEGEATEDDILAESTTIEEYDDNMDLTKSKIENFLQNRVQNGAAGEVNVNGNGAAGNGGAACGAGVANEDAAANGAAAVAGANAGGGDMVHPINGNFRNVELPKFRIRSFDGDHKNWLSFWAQFRTIHENEEIQPIVKFQQLKQCMVPGSKASGVVDGFPQTAENYPKVIESLKERFGDEVILKEIYVRELLKVVNSFKRNDSSIASIYDELVSHMRSLESLGVTMEQCGVFLYPMIESSMPVELIQVWQRNPASAYGNGGDDRTMTERLTEFMKFLRQEVKGEERLQYVKGEVKKTEVRGQQHPRKRVMFRESNKEDLPTVAGLYAGEGRRCLFCDKGHDSKNCFAAKKMKLDERRGCIDKKKCCYLCLRPNHFVRDCKSFSRCEVCGKKHATLIHDFMVKSPSNNEMASSSDNADEVKKVHANFAGSCQVFLGTFITTLVNGSNKVEVRALFDPGAQKSYIGRKTAELLKLDSIGEAKFAHSLFGGSETPVQTLKKYQVKVKNRIGNGFCCINVLEKEKICGDLPKLKKGPWLNELKNNGIWISDLKALPESIELLVGGDVFGKLLTGNIRQLSNGLTAIETTLAWVVMGAINVKNEESERSLAMTVTSLHVAEASMDKLWSLESIGIQDPVELKSKQEREMATKEHFLKTVSRQADGRYSVRLPWVNEEQRVPDNRSIAEARLVTTTKKLVDQGKYEDYDNVFKQWISEGFIEEVESSEHSKPSSYLPHRAVFKPESLTTPLRPVFDASCKSKRTPSLNDCLEKGPNLLELIPSLLLRFREKRIGVTSDIRKAFQMVDVQDEDRDFLRFLWWEDYGRRKMKIYRHKRVVFGVNSSPFLLAAVLEAHLKSVEEERRPVADKLLQSFYVDNCITSVSTYEEYEEFRRQSTEMMAEARMDLRLWQCSSREVTRVGSSNECGLGTAGVAAAEGERLTTVLGMQWDKVDEVMSCEFNFGELSKKFTKRNILSYVQQIFDPLGILCPALLAPKKLLQEAWSEKTGWDEELSMDQQLTFRKWMEESGILKTIAVPRSFTGEMYERVNWQVHCFCDASLAAYAAVVYLRADDGQNVSVQLMMAKSRISPLKKMTIPRLELMACCIGSRLVELVKKSLSLGNVPVHYWSDSTTALSWIKGNDEWGTFVGNRVKEILSLSRSDAWRHVPGPMNPADLPSRGCTPAQLLQSRWWEGPAWLRCISEEWPNQMYSVNREDVIAEKRKTPVVVSLSTDCRETPWYAKFPCHSKNVRILAWVKKIIDKWRKRIKEVGRLTLKETSDAELMILKFVQSEAFSGDKPVSGIKVTRVKDLFRVKTKLLYREDTIGFKMPILLPNSHVVVDHIIEEEHRIHGHAGVQFLMGSLRERYWILQGRKAIRRVVSSCVTCRRFTAMSRVTEEAPLPEDRVQNSKAFQTIGVDLAGPLYLKGSEKVWVVLITCAVFRCVHLELVKSLSTEAFLDAFTRFMDRRGRPITVYSDNGTNFVGAVNLFKKINWEKVSRTTNLHRINWKFNPPSAAWWGGWWERLVRSMKDLLKRILGRARVTYEKLLTYLTSVESCLNGRPLTTVTEDPDDLRPLTPGMFLNDLPVMNYVDLDFIKASDFQQQIQTRKTVLDEFRSRFRREYLGLLFQRETKQQKSEVKVGDVVLIGAENKKRWDWPLGKVIELCPGKDGVVRLVKVKTAHGVLNRPVQRLYPLEVSSPVVIQESSNQKESKKTAPETSKVSKKISVTRSGRVVKKPSRFEA